MDKAIERSFLIGLIFYAGAKLGINILLMLLIFLSCFTLMVIFKKRIQKKLLFYDKRIDDWIKAERREWIKEHNKWINEAYERAEKRTGIKK